MTERSKFKGGLRFVGEGRNPKRGYTGSGPAPISIMKSLFRMGSEK